MTRDEALERLRRHEAELKRLGVLRLYMFGSTARDEAGQHSDVDLFFDYEKGRLGIYELIDVKDHKAAILGCRADIMTRDSLHKVIRADIEASAACILMSATSLLPRLHDILEAIDPIHAVLANVTLAEFEKD